MGASIASAVMQSMPIGVAKMLLTTMASGETRPYVGTKDICKMYPLPKRASTPLQGGYLPMRPTELPACAAAPEPETSEDRTLIGCMMFGVTTPCVLRASEFMEKQDNDVIINHAIGSGGQSDGRTDR